MSSFDISWHKKYTMEVHESYLLHVTDDKFYIEPTDANLNEVVVIDRLGHDIQLRNRDDILPHATQVTVYGIIGIIRLIAGPYLIVITGHTKVGEINNNVIWQVTGTQLLPFAKTMFHITEKQRSDNSRYVSMVEHMLSPAYYSYYYSTSYDLTHTLQRLYTSAPEFRQMTLLERADTRFVWNGNLLQDLRQQSELARYCLPVLCGFVEIAPCAINGKIFTYTLISRRSCFRAGVRYYMRGVDSEGHAANFVETEQLIEHNGTMCSYVQTRGSIPLFWCQYPNLKYKPDPIIETMEQNGLTQLGALQRHFASQVVNYGRQVIINLLDQKGQEKDLFMTFTANVQQASNPRIRYQPFDFHHECRKMRWDRLSLLVDQIENDHRLFGYFMVDRGGRVLKRQDGVFRTNCIDCLDRTNVVQSLLGRKTVQEQLTALEVLHSGQRIEEQIAFEATFKSIWADNADACAKQYAGTGALKTDYTRTGRRTRLGALKDGYNSVVRYYLNNFYDGYRQDSIDLFLGNYLVDPTESLTRPSPWDRRVGWMVFILPVVFILALAMFFISLLLPTEQLGENLMYIMFWLGASMLTLSVIYYYGNEFVDRPRLAHPVGKLKLE